MKTRTILLFTVSMVVLVACGGVKSVVITPYTAGSSKMIFSISSDIKDERFPVPEKTLTIMRDHIQRALSEKNLLASAGDSIFRKVDILITEYIMRPDALRLTVGIMAGCDSIKSKVTISDSKGQVIGESHFESSECAAWGIAAQVIEGHMSKIADYLVGKSG